MWTNTVFSIMSRHSVVSKNGMWFLLDEKWKSLFLLTYSIIKNVQNFLLGNIRSISTSKAKLDLRDLIFIDQRKILLTFFSIDWWHLLFPSYINKIYTPFFGYAQDVINIIRIFIDTFFVQTFRIDLFWSFKNVYKNYL